MYRKGKGVSITFIVTNVILLMSCALVCWTAQQVITDGKMLATHSTQIDALENRQLYIEARSTAQMETLADIRVINARLSNIEKSQERIETKVEEHLKLNPP